MGRLADVFDISVEVLKVQEQLIEALIRFRDQTGAYNQLTHTLERLELSIMARLNEQSDQFGARLDALEAQQTKALGEIRTALDAALAVQVTPEELAAAVAAAKTAQKTEDEAGFNTAVDAAFAPLTDKLNKVQAATQALDDVVPDAPAPNPNPNPTPTPEPNPNPNPNPTPVPNPEPVPNPNPTPDNPPVVNPEPVVNPVNPGDLPGNLPPTSNS